MYIYDGMANTALAMGELDKAEQLYKETIKGLLQEGKSQDDNAIIDISLKIATVYVMQHKYTEANAGFEYCIGHLEKKLHGVDRDVLRTEDPDDESGNLNLLALLGMCLNTYAKFLLMQARYPEAQDQLKKTLKIAKQVFGENDNQVAVLYSDLALVASRMKDYDTAKTHATSAIRLGRAINSDDLPMFYCNMCYICVDRKDWGDARSHGKFAIKAAKQVGDTLTEERAEACIKLAEKKRYSHELT